VVLTDIEMPIEDGYKLVELIRASAAPRPAVALTAYAGPQDRDRLLAAGFKAHLTKPVQAPELLRTLAGVSSTVVR
jgi:CheY-like chemotaxis protein